MLSNPDLGVDAAAMFWTIQNARRKRIPAGKAVTLGAGLKVVCDGARARLGKPPLERLAAELRESKSIAQRFAIGYLVGPHRLDVGFPGVLLGVQIGSQWRRADFGTMQSALSRDRYFARMGWTILRFPPARITRDPGGVAREIERMYHRLET